jgi:LmbE family N-acetylglucosaminyl deacetylase
MPTKLSKGKYNLLCVAHPDDETIFFGGLLQSRAFGRLPWMVVCMTSDGNAARKRQFARACKELGVAVPEFWSYPDRYEKRLPVEEIAARLSELPAPKNVFTHGILGEYGHPHHQDVCFAVHSAFRDHGRVYSVAYNTFPEIEVQLTARQFEKKARILTKIYGSETSRFLNLLPSTFVEGFLRLRLEEVEAVYSYLAEGKKLDARQLKANRWLKSYLPKIRALKRPF